MMFVVEATGTFCDSSIELFKVIGTPDHYDPIVASELSTSFRKKLRVSSGMILSRSSKIRRQGAILRASLKI